MSVPNKNTTSKERKLLQHQRWFRRGQKWRTGSEGRISVLKRRHGLRRCLYPGLDGMRRWVGLGVTPGEGSLDPTWSPDGNFLAYSPDYSDLNSAVDLVDLRTHRVSTVPGSEGLFSPRWSRDGRFLFALSHKLQNSQKLLMYTFATQKWEQLLLAKSIDYPTWSRSGEYIHFFDSVEDGTPFYRVRVSDHKLERIGVVSLSRGMAKGQFGQWTGLAPDDSPLLLHDTGFQEIYALDLQLP